MQKRSRVGALVLLSLLHFALGSPFPCGEGGAGPRLLVSSHVAYGKPRDFLLHSLRSVGFQDFCTVVVVVAGAPFEAAPARGGRGERHVFSNVTYLYTTQNAYEWTAINALRLNLRHPLVADASGFLLVHDTSLFHPGFTNFWASLTAIFAADASAVVAPDGPFTSSVVAFGSAVAQKLDDAFARNLTKLEALDWELGQLGPQEERFGGHVRYLREREPVRGGGRRPGPRVSAAICLPRCCLLLSADSPLLAQEKNKVDIYGTGWLRALYLYPDFWL